MQKKIMNGESLSPAGLLFIPADNTWKEIDENLVEVSFWIWEKAKLARAVAKKARKQGDLIKWKKFAAIARAYEMAGSRLHNVGVPF